MHDLHSSVPFHHRCTDSQIIFLEIYIYFLPAVLNHSSWSIFKGRVEIWTRGHRWLCGATNSSYRKFKFLGKFEPYSPKTLGFYTKLLWTKLFLL